MAPPVVLPARAARLHGLGRAAAVVGAAGMACVAYGIAVERRWYRLRAVTLHGALTRPTSRPLRMLHISDLHLAPPQDHKVGFLASLAELRADVVVATGDLMGTFGAERAVAAALAPLTADGTPGLAVLGSHDVYGPRWRSPLAYFTRPDSRVHGPRHDTDTLVDGLSATGWRTLRGETGMVTTPLGTVAVGAIDDPHLPGTVIPPPAALRADADDPVLRLGLVHAPYLAALDALVDAGHDLLLSGHTHGGQVRLPGVGALTANCDLPLDQARGASRYRERWLHVSPGLGTSPHQPFRFACRPEATLLEVW